MQRPRGFQKISGNSSNDLASFSFPVWVLRLPHSSGTVLRQVGFLQICNKFPGIIVVLPHCLQNLRFHACYKVAPEHRLPGTYPALRICCTSPIDSQGSTCLGRAPSFGQAFLQDRMIQSIREWVPWIPWAPRSLFQRAECVAMLLIFFWFLPHERNTTSPCVPPLH